MSFSVHDITVPSMEHGLNVLDDYLDRAREFESKRGLEEGEALRAKLAPDMLNLGQQVSISCNKVENHLCKLIQRDPPEPAIIEMAYQPLKRRLIATKQFLTTLRPEDLAPAQTHVFALKPPIVRGWFGGDEYIRLIVLPDFYFHIATAHAILRHLGASVGKRDYLGNLSQHSGGDYS